MHEVILHLYTAAPVDQAISPGKSAGKVYSNFPCAVNVGRFNQTHWNGNFWKLDDE